MFYFLAENRYFFTFYFCSFLFFKKNTEILFRVILFQACYDIVLSSVHGQFLIKNFDPK